MVSTPILLTLQSKIQLTHDVYELVYSSENLLNILPGQFLLCDTSGDPKLKRSYSVSWAEGNNVAFIIKRLPSPQGTGGSVAICDQEIGHDMQAWGPLGKFVLQDTTCPKVFIGTGTGFAPLYFMLRYSIEKREKIKEKRGGLFFLFGVRELRDVFYLDQLEKWRKSSSFDYEIYCSRETSELPEKHHQGRVTDFLKEKREKRKEKREGIGIDPLSFGEGWGEADTEFYICGSPAMVTEVRGTLQDHGISKEKVFFEQY